MEYEAAGVLAGLAHSSVTRASESVKQSSERVNTESPAGDSVVNREQTVPESLNLAEVGLHFLFGYSYLY